MPGVLLTYQSCFAAPQGSYNDNQPACITAGLPQNVKVLIQKTKGFKVVANRSLIEQSQHHLLTLLTGNGGNPYVNGRSLSAE